MEQIGNSTDKEMHFLDHIGILRGHLIRITIAITALTVLAFMNINFLFEEILLASRSSDFITFKFLCDLSHSLNLSDTLCIEDQLLELQSVEMSGQFSIALWSSFVIGFIIAFPYILWELWRFIAPGLKDKEKRYSKGIVFYSSVLFLLGVAFGYYLIIPLSVNFLGSFKVADFIDNDINITSYISLVTNLALSCGLIFELPIIVYFLARLGLIDDVFMKTYRKHAVIITLVLAAVITPPDFLSQVLVALPVMGLYEIGILIAKMASKK
ncbi:MAG: twin-arginine translocase subunit TatC [Flavobacteriales bacterium]